jgi:hypothetical protein
MEFWLSRSLSHELFSFHDGILAIKEPFTRTFLFSRWNSGYQEAFHMNFSFFTMGLFFFHNGILAIKEPFTQTFLFHDGILAIKEPFSRTFLFSRWSSGYQGAFLTNFSFFTMEFSKYALWGKTLFIYITKSIYIGSASLKTLPLDLEPPLQGKEYGSPYSNATTKRIAIVFSPEVTYRHVTRFFYFSRM